MDKNLGKIKEELIEEFDKVGKIISEIINDQERFERYLHYQNGIRFAIESINRLEKPEEEPE